MGWCGIIHSENFPSPIPDVLGDNRFLFSITNAVFVVDLTNVSMVAQNPINMLSVPNPSLLGSNPVFVEFLGNQCRRLNLNESLKDSLDDPCFLLHDGQLLVFHTVSHRNATADPFTFLPAGGHLVAYTLGDNLPLILREGDKNVKHHAPGAGGGIDFLRHRDELCAPFVKFLGEVCKITDGSGESVDLVNHDDVDQPGFTVGKELLKRRAFHIAAGISSVVITSREADPSVGFLAGDIGFTSLPLSIQTVKFLIQSFLNGLACVNRASLLWNRLHHHHFTPKKSLPFQRVPVISRAMAESD